MTDQQLHQANSINDRLASLKKHLSAIEYIEKESNEDGGNVKLTITSHSNLFEEELKHQFLPIILDDFVIDYKNYLIKSIENTQNEFDSLFTHNTQ